MILTSKKFNLILKMMSCSFSLMFYLKVQQDVSLFTEKSIFAVRALKVSSFHIALV